MIAAMGRNRVIGDSAQRGANRGLPWRLRSDLQRFRALTMGKPILLGRRTAELLGKPLPGRDNLVLTRDRSLKMPGFHLVHEVEEAKALAEQCARERESEEVMVIGGGEVYRLFVPYADRLYLTVVQGEFSGEVTFPLDELWQKGAWRVCHREQIPADAQNDHAHTFWVLERVETPEQGACLASPEELLHQGGALPASS